MKNYLHELPRPFLALAPLDDVTDTVFRQIVVGCAKPDLLFTEFVNVDALQSAGRQSTLKRLKYKAVEQPLVAQIWGKALANFEKTARELVEMGFMGVDINMGCPDKAVVKNGCGGGLIKNPELAVEMIQAVKSGVGDQLPVSVKTRIGFNEFNEDWLKAILEQKLNMLTVHLRTVKEQSLVPAQWELMAQIKTLRDEISPDTLLVGNGDVGSRKQAEELAQKYGIDGIMIGRGVFHDPYVFSDQSNWLNNSKEQKIDLYAKHVKLFMTTWEEGERKLHTLNKFCKIYINGFDGARELRDSLMHAKTAEELLDLLEQARRSS